MRHVNISVGMILLLALQTSNAVVIRPDTNDPFITATLLNPANSIDTINNEWDLKKPINAWGISVTLSGEQYGFKPGMADSIISIEIDIRTPSTGQADHYYAFSIGDERYVTLLHDLDGSVWGADNHKTGIGGVFAGPKCNVNNQIFTGDPSDLMNNVNNNDFKMLQLMAKNNVGLDLFSKTPIGRNNGAVRFEFINNAISDTFTVRFFQKNYPDNGKDCVYQGAAPFFKDFKVYSTLGGNDQAPQRIKKYKVGSTNTGTLEPTSDPTIAPSKNPSLSPTEIPSIQPTKLPSLNPSIFPSISPSNNPSQNPSASPTSISHDIYESENYIGVTKLLSTNDANKFCLTEFGSNLASVLNANDQMEIETNILKPMYQDTRRMVAHFGYRNYNGVAKWLNGGCVANSILDATWHSTASSPHKNQCGYFNVLWELYWDIGSCELRRYFVCDNPKGKYGNAVC